MEGSAGIILSTLQSAFGMASTYLSSLGIEIKKVMVKKVSEDAECDMCIDYVIVLKVNDASTYNAIQTYLDKIKSR